MKTSRSILLVLLALLLPACEENAVLEIAGPPPGGSSIKFFNFAPGAPGVNFYANDTKVKATSSSIGCSGNGIPSAIASASWSTPALRRIR